MHKYEAEPGKKQQLIPAAASAQFKKQHEGFCLADNRAQTIQQKIPAQPKNKVAQLKLDYSGTYSSASLPSKTHDQFNSSVRPETGAVNSANIFVTHLKPTTEPANLDNMDDWREYLKDPSRDNKQVLTRMHAIRGRFGGPSEAGNMFLGTALSNNFNSNSHYYQVEKPIGEFLSEQGAEGVDYTVTPDYSTQPGYITKRYATVPSPQRNDFRKWAANGLPATFRCDANFYKRGDKGKIMVKRTSQTLPADTGATVGPITLAAGGALAGAGTVATGGAIAASYATGLGAVAAGTAAVAAAPVVATLAGIAALGIGAGAALKYGGYFLRPRKKHDNDN